MFGNIRNFAIVGLIIALFVALFVIGCNNDKKANSTDSKADTSSTTATQADSVQIAKAALAESIRVLVEVTGPREFKVGQEIETLYFYNSKDRSRGLPESLFAMAMERDNVVPCTRKELEIIQKIMAAEKYYDITILALGDFTYRLDGDKNIEAISTKYKGEGDNAKPTYQLGTVTRTRGFVYGGDVCPAVKKTKGDSSAK